MSGGILGQGVPQGAGILGGFNQYAQDNAASLLGLGAGLLSGDWGAGAAGYAQGMAQDERTRLIRQKQAEEKQLRVAARQEAQKHGIDPMLAEANPSFVFDIAAKKYAPKEYGIEETYLRGLQKSDPDRFNSLMESKYAPKSDLPPDVREYQFDMKQRNTLGQPVVPYHEWQVQKKGNENKVLAGDRKVIYGAEDENLNLDSTISTLAEAERLNTQTFTGTGSAMWGRLGTSGLPGTGYIDQDKAKATAEFGKIMSFEAIKTMAETLKGATTDNELNKFVEILADPNTPPEIRGRTIQRMKTLAERKRQLNNERINEISGGTYFKNRANGGRGDNPSAQDAITVDGYTIRPR